MTTIKKRVFELAHEVLRPSATFSQAVIDIAEVIEDLLESDPSSDEIGSVSYKASIMRDIAGVGVDKVWLTEASDALYKWSEEVRETNKILGIPPQNN